LEIFVGRGARGKTMGLQEREQELAPIALRFLLEVVKKAARRRVGEEGQDAPQQGVLLGLLGELSEPDRAGTLLRRGRGVFWGFSGSFPSRTGSRPSCARCRMLLATPSWIFFSVMIRSARSN